MIRRLLLAALLCLACAPAWAAVVFDSDQSAVCRASSNTVTCSGTSSPTIGSGANRALVVAVAVGSSTEPTTHTVTWNGTNVPFIGKSTFAPNPQEQQTYIFCLAAPVSGNKSIVATTSAGIEIHVFSVSFTGVDQTTPCQNFTSALNQVNTTAAITVTSATGDAPVAVFSQGDTTLTTCNNNTIIVSNGVVAFGAAANYASGAATVSMQCSGSGSSTWEISAVDVLAAGGGASVPHSLMLMGVGQ